MTPTQFCRYGIVTILLLAFMTPALAVTKSAPLRKNRDAALQAQLERALSRIGLQKAVKKKTLGIALVDITDVDHPRLAAVNGDEMMYAASLPKIAILLGAYESINTGKIKMDERTRETLTNMIRFSSNKAATEMLNRVGMPYLAKVLRSPRYKLYDPEFNGGLWVGKEYGRAKAWKRDPLHNLSHGATAIQVARFYYMLETGNLVSREASREMKAILGDPGIHHKFVKGLENADRDSLIFRKSGSWRNWHSDSALVERNGHRYIAVALAEDPGAGKWLSRLIVAFDDLIMKPPADVAQLGKTAR